MTPGNFIAAAVFALVAAIALPSAHAQAPKELKTKKGVSVGILNLLNARPDCKAGPVALPVLREKPTNGTIQIQIGVTDVAASGNCPFRKLPTVILIYTPKADFVGSDSLQIDIEALNRTTTFSYHVTVQDPIVGETL